MTLHERAKAIRAKLKKNGGPTATEAADVIAKLLKEIPEPTRGELHPLRLRLIQIRTKNPRQIRPDAETRNWRKIEKHVTTEDVDLLVKFYKLPQSQKPDETWSRKVSPTQIMSQYHDQLQLAETFRDKHPHLFKDRSEKQQLAEPTGWQKIAPGNLGDRSWTLLCKQYPDIAKELFNELSNPVQTPGNNLAEDSKKTLNL